VADGVRLMLDDLPRHGPAGSGLRSSISSRGMPDALSAAILCARSRASLGFHDAPPEVIEAAGKAMQRKNPPGRRRELPTFKMCRRLSERPPRASNKSEHPNPQSCCTSRGTALGP
jgi:hypothetical protein